MSAMTFDEWLDQHHAPDTFKSLTRRTAFSKRVQEDFKTGWDAAFAQMAQLLDEQSTANEHLKFVERWAVHHGSKPGMTATEALGVIAHYPPIRKITESYGNGVRPQTFDPYAEIQRLADVLEEARNGLKWYRDATPDFDSPVDDEMEDKIEQALAAVQQVTHAGR